MYEWIAETFGVGDGIARAMAFIIAMAIVLGLIGLFVFILRQLTGARVNAGRNRQPRIAVMDAANIDARRRLLLVRRDNVEHLILVGGPTDVVVEQNIVRGMPVSATYPRQGGIAVTAPATQPIPTGEPEPAPAPVPTPTPVTAPTPIRASAPVPAATARPHETALTALRARSEPTEAENVKALRPRLGSDAPAAARAPAVSRASEAPHPVAPRPAERSAAFGIRSELGSKAGASVAAAGAAVADLARSLSKAGERNTAASDTSEIRRQVTPPSSGPAARARTAFPNAAPTPPAPMTASTPPVTPSPVRPKPPMPAAADAGEGPAKTSEIPAVVSTPATGNARVETPDAPPPVAAARQAPAANAPVPPVPPEPRTAEIAPPSAAEPPAQPSPNAPDASAEPPVTAEPAVADAQSGQPNEQPQTGPTAVETTEPRQASVVDRAAVTDQAATTAQEAPEPPPPRQEENAGVNAIEEEMAKLLNEITEQGRK